MFRIGDFSRLSMVPVSALRYYDEIGLLKPLRVDEFTGYRYYSMNQLPRLNRILALKDMGLSLDQIAPLLNDELTPEQIHGMLKLKQAELARQATEAQARLVRVEAWLREFEKEKVSLMPQHELVITSRPAVQVASIKETFANIPAMVGSCQEMMGYIGEKGVPIAGPLVFVYYHKGFRQEDLEAELACPIAGDFPETDRIKVRELPAEPMVASVTHKGSYNNISESYQAAGRLIEQQGYEILGPWYEVYTHYDEQNEANHLTDIQVPVKKV
jgi:DNA-binding transcriptional MerR regulator